MEQKTRIFISYSHKDQRDCERIVSMIVAQPQFDVWYDKSLVGGDKFRKTIVETIKSVAYFIVLISRASAGSE